MNLPFDEWIVQQRWYAGRNRELSSAAPAAVVSLRDDLDLVLPTSPTPKVRRSAIRSSRWDAGAADAATSSGSPIFEFLNIATIGAEGDRTAYDALYNPVDAKYLRRWSIRRRRSVPR
jgi:maltokinase